MDTRSKSTREPFTWQLYAEYLDLALESGYSFIGFEEMLGGATPERPSILLRHDVDYAPEWIDPIASLEQERGIQATYCVLTDSPLYSLRDESTAATIEATLGRGHWLGLHLDASRIEHDKEIVERAQADSRDLESRFGAPVVAVSFHMPTRRQVGHIELPGNLLNTYGPRFFKEIGYVSDSNQGWRGEDLRELLSSRRHRCLQILIHPFWWRDRYSPMLEKLEELAATRGVDSAQIITPEQRALGRTSWADGRAR